MSWLIIRCITQSLGGDPEEVSDVIRCLSDRGLQAGGGQLAEVMENS
ncbi:hypothetical protein LPB19_03265 [Marinobacter salinisoli]|uniref:Uncharacterized protein n=1 Tax=Marinobacter salinisoli TaxID=2769486 RepID=A0ABX7MSV5_9GAMM|nr:hypothetical protein [Marinobacter salinisoli]QSP95452.1 hypothetical protein LPB19_03265 [Marinobacter salinisoli]